MSLLWALLSQVIWEVGALTTAASLSPDAAFLLSDAHVRAMLQCLEAVEQNNPRLLAQIDVSMVRAGGSLCAQ